MLEKFKVQFHNSIIEALKKIDHNKEGFLVCVDNEDKVKGVITDGDIRRYLIRNNSLDCIVDNCMTKSFVYIHLDSSFEEMAEKFKSSKIFFLPILDKNKGLVNIITKKQFHILLLEDLKYKLTDNFTNLNIKSLEQEIINRPWGFYKSIIYTKHSQAKVITVFPKGELSLQEHKKREEHWVIIKGKGKVILGESILDVYPGKYIYIPKGCKHRIINTSEFENLIFAEVQLGEYFGEDDIIRYKDKYNRG